MREQKTYQVQCSPHAATQKCCAERRALRISEEMYRERRKHVPSTEHRASSLIRQRVTRIRVHTHLQYAVPCAEGCGSPYPAPFESASQWRSTNSCSLRACTSDVAASGTIYQVRQWDMQTRRRCGRTWTYRCWSGIKYLRTGPDNGDVCAFGSLVLTDRAPVAESGSHI